MLKVCENIKCKKYIQSELETITLQVFEYNTTSLKEKLNKVIGMSLIVKPLLGF